MLFRSSLVQIFFLFYLFVHCSARDTLSRNNSIYDNGGETLVSAGETFELGFFTPGENSGRRYIGIWYYRSNPRTVVWVANRDNPLLDSNGVFTIAEDGNLMVLDGHERSCWSTNLQRSSSAYRKMKLMDSGNLVVGDEDEETNLMTNSWQSFENPTDTFLPGMKMDASMALVSWKSYDDPASGNFSFQVDQETNEFMIWKRSVRHWRSGISGNVGSSNNMPSPISYFLSNFTTIIEQNSSVPHITTSMYSDTRMVMSFTGQTQYLKRDSEKIWSLIWAQPRTRCSLFNACGNYGTCNSNNELVCKCLPGFHPVSLEFWNSGDYSGGCTRKSPMCSDNFARDTFLELKRMKVGRPDSQFKAKSEMECKIECLNNCQCQAFSYDKAQDSQMSENGSPTCWIWSEDLSDLQEEYDGGRDLNIRVAASDIESTTRNCGTCGTNIVPYPLSFGETCGDPMYYSFQCNISSGQLSFKALCGTYRVTRINPETQNFFIQIVDTDGCKALSKNGKILELNQSSPFQVIRWCNADLGNLSSDVAFTGVNEVEIGWIPPSEPTCFSSVDCKDWPSSICNATKGGLKKCLCEKNLRWNGLSLNCTEDASNNKRADGLAMRKFPLSLILVIVSVTSTVLLLLSVVITCAWLRRRLAKVQGARKETIFLKLWEDGKEKNRFNSYRYNAGSRGSMKMHLRRQLYGSQRLVQEMIESGRFNEAETKMIDVPLFNLENILAATNNFSNKNKLGQGGFGPVYMAKFAGGEQMAVKRLSSCSSQGLEEFKNEVVLIAKLQHRNLVRLLGYCVEGDEKMLIYEYMPNKSLDSFLFDRKLCTFLDWQMRCKIILGIARGLLYLHQDSRLTIIHRDLKTSNILLDNEMNPKISDFGLARIFGGKETAANTNRVVGTYGYIAPEYALDGLFSFKSDVFSFGVVVLEIISGKRNAGFYQPEKSLSLLGYAWNLWKVEKALELVDHTLSKTLNIKECLKCINVGLLCVQEDPSERPAMSNVLSMLGSETATLPSPKQPAFVVRRCPFSRASSSSSKPETCSNNGLTVTLENGR